MKQASKDDSLVIEWYLPTVVRDERRYQMLNAACEKLGAVQDIELVLGHSLNITRDILSTSVDAIITKQIADLKVNELQCDVSCVDWNKVIEAAIFRNPPFEPGDKEKGFRDLVILETFSQLVESSPTTPASCRLCLVTADGILRTAAETRFHGKNNVICYPTIEDLQSMINTLASDVNEIYANEVKKRATTIFRERGNKSSLFYKEAVLDRIVLKFHQKLDEVPGYADEAKLKSFTIGAPTLRSKQKSTWHWSSIVSITQIALKSDSFSFRDAEESDEDRALATAKAEFEVNWSFILTKNDVIRSAKISDIVFVEKEWKKENSLSQLLRRFRKAHDLLGPLNRSSDINTDTPEVSPDE
jgi:hypothetical protein